MKSDLAHTLSILGHPQRLAVFRLVMRRHPDPVPAGQIAEALALKPPTLSAYLAALTQAGLLAQTRDGTSLRYGVALDAVQGLVDDLLNDCCRGRADLCAPLWPPDAPLPANRKGTAMADRKMSVLFICTGNSARSIFAECILRDFAPDRFTVYSAGTRARSELNPFALEVLRANGHDVSALHAKTIERFQGPDAPPLDFVFTVCDRAANEECPPWPGQPVTGHWGVADPVKATGTEAERRLAFRTAYGQLRARIKGFQALPLDTLDRMSLQRAVDALAHAEPVGETE